MAPIYVYPSEASDEEVVCDTTWDAADCILRHDRGRYEVRQDRDQRGRFTGTWTIWHARFRERDLRETVASGSSPEDAMAVLVKHAMEWWPGVVVTSVPLAAEA
ncbi:MAG: hypothetical protein FD176_170 [Rhodospirillaceae bacterium]|nr:MAG: hypothetical protein FD176_170 [Rhodospirillaceae bacterium]TNC98688.1 MAG: hypothetical protein FD119_159 [Stygiobacter sp.]